MQAQSLPNLMKDEKYGSAEELFRRKWLRRGCDGGGHWMSLQDNTRARMRDFAGT